MAVSSTVRKVGPFTGAGTVATFPFSFMVFQASDVLVASLNVATGVQTTLVLNTDYSVSVNPNQTNSAGGTVTLLAGTLAVGYSLIISSAIAQLQGTQLTNQGGFYPEGLTNALDMITILVQQLQVQVNQCLQIPITDPSTVTAQLPSAAQRAGMYLTFDANGNPQANIGVATAGGILGYAESVSTAGQILFPTPLYVRGANNLMVIGGGLVLTNGIDYTETTPSSITLTAPSIAGLIYTFRAIL